MFMTANRNMDLNHLSSNVALQQSPQAPGFLKTYQENIGGLKPNPFLNPEEAKRATPLKKLQTPLDQQLRLTLINNLR